MMEDAPLTMAKQDDAAAQAADRLVEAKGDDRPAARRSSTIPPAASAPRPARRSRCPAARAGPGWDPPSIR